MKIFDAHISGSLSVSSSAQIEGDLTVLGTVTATISGTTTNALTASEAPRYTLTSSFHNFTSSYIGVSSSLNTRVGNLESFSSSLDGNFVSETEFGSHTGSVNSFTSSASGRLTSIETSTGSLNTFTSSTNGRLTSIETSTGALNSFTSSIDTTIKNKLNTEGVISGSVQVTISGTTGYSTFSSSIATTTSGIENRAGYLETSTGALNTFTSSASSRLSSIETSTGSLNTFSSSTNTRLTSLESASGSIRTDFNSYTSSANGRLTSIETSTGSLNTFSSSTNSRLTAIETSTGSLNSYTSSNTTNINAIHTATSSLNSYTSSTNTRLGVIETSTSSLNTFTSSATSRLNSIETSTGSLNSYTSSNNTTLGTLQTATSSLNTFSSSANTRLNAVETSTSSLNSFTSSIDTTIKNKLNTDGVISGSAQVTLSSTTGYSTFSSSIATTNAGQDSKITSLEGKTGSYATTGSNIFIGNQTITGSLYVSQDLIVAGSSSIQHISSSIVNIADNIITVNAQNPSIRFGGLAVIDSGSSPQVSGSILFDSVNDQWVFVHQNQSTVTSSVIMMGPQTYNSLGSESYPTTNKILKSVNAEHLGDSNITDTGTKVSINSNTEITGTFTVGGGGKIIASTMGGDEGGEILLGKPATNTTIAGDGVTIDIYQNRLRIFEQGGNNRGAYLDITSFGNGVSTKLNGTADTASYVEYSNVANKPSLVSGSSQITFLSISSIPSGLVSGSSQVLNGSGVWSGSAQLPSGVVSGSSQVLAGTTIHSGAFFNGISVVSGSAQISFNGITDKPTLVSGSSQITYGSLTGIPSGIVSGSSQISFGSISGIPSGLVSGSSQISFGSISGVPSGLVSGSSQITFGSISGVPSGLVSGSSQISIASTSGFGTYLNQAVLTTSTPTFDYVITSNNGNGTNVRLGDDAWIGDVNLANTTRLMGVQNNANGYLIFGNGDNTALGRASTGALTYGGNTVWHSGNDGASSGLDADLLDGSHASAFSPVAGSSSITTVGTISSGTWNGSSISTTYTDAKVTSVSAGTGISVNATTGAVTVTNTITNNNQLTNGAGYITSSSSISGAAARLSTRDNRTISPSADNAAELRFGFTSYNNNNTSPWADYLHLRSYSDNSGGADNLVMFSKSGIGMRIWQQTYGSATAYSSYKDVAWTDGTNASGTWSINISGNASTATTATSLSSMNISQFTNNSGYATLSGSNSFSNSYNEFGDGVGSVSNDGGWNGRLNVAGSAHARLDVTSVSDGIITTIYSHTGQGVGRMGTYSNHPLLLMINGSGRVRVDTSGHLSPEANGTQNLGSSSYRWNTVFTSDLSMSNGIGDYTIVEGEEDLFIYNNKNNKVFKFLLQEVDPSIVPPKKI